MAGDGDGFLPENGQFPGLVPTGARLSAFNGKERQKFLGRERAAFFEQHSLRTVFTRDYTLNGERLTLESYQLDSDAGASGIYYYYSGRQLRGMGREVDVGAQAVLDTLNKSRNLYFYKGRWFFSIIYTGKEPVPDLTELARFLAGRIPGTSARPDGFEYLDVEGVAAKYAKVTSGNALNFDIFPPGVYAVVPDGGPQSTAYVIDFGDSSRAEDRQRDFQRYLRVNAADFRNSRQSFGKETVVCSQALDGKQGKLVFAQYGRYIVVINKLNDYSDGLTVLGRILNKMYNDKRNGKRLK